MAILSLAFTAKGDENIKIYSIDASAIEIFLTLEQDGESDITWLKNQYLGDLKRDGGDKNRTNRIGLSAKDFIELYYPGTQLGFRHWWEGERHAVIDFMMHNPNAHVQIISKHYGLFPWHLLPMPNGKAIADCYPVSVNPPGKQVEDFSSNDACIISEGDLDSNFPSGQLFGWPTVRDFLIQSDLSSRGLVSACTTHSFESLTALGKQSSVINPESPLDFLTQKLGRVGEYELPSILVHSGHGDEHGFQLANGKRMSKDFVELLEATEGVIELFFADSCHSAEFASAYELIESKKVRTFVGHIGMGDESIDVHTFKLYFFDAISKGECVGNAIFKARQRLNPDEPASGSFVLLGDPRTILSLTRLPQLSQNSSNQ